MATMRQAKTVPRTCLALAVVSSVAVFAGVARSEVFAVPDEVRHMRGVHDETHTLRAEDGTRLGEQRSRAVVAGDQLLLDVVTNFASGERWDEHAEMGLADVYRATSFRKVRRRDGVELEEQAIDFGTGAVRWLSDGERGSRTLQLQPDTYIGPMLGVILAAVPGRSSGAGSFQTVVFRPDPSVYTLRAEVVDQEDYRVGKLREPTTKLRLKADLGPVQNALFASFIPTHYFWFTRDDPPEFFAFEGSLGYGGPELRMIPARPGLSTAAAGSAPER